MKVTATIFNGEGLEDKIVMDGVCLEDTDIEHFVSMLNIYLPKHIVVYCKKEKDMIQITFEMDDEEEVKEYEDENICKCGLDGC